MIRMTTTSTKRMLILRRIKTIRMMINRAINPISILMTRLDAGRFRGKKVFSTSVK
jgi:hypothetical protein